MDFRQFPECKAIQGKCQKQEKYRYEMYFSLHQRGGSEQVDAIRTKSEVYE